MSIGIRPYIDNDVAAGWLVAPFGLSVPKGSCWYLVYRAQRSREPAFLAFQRWIRQAARTPIG